jgi:zinc protease
MVRRKALEAVFGSHPYGRPLRGTVESLEKISRPDITYFHERFYIANNAELIVTGDAAAEAVTQLARSRLGAWKKGNKVPATFRPPEPAQTRRLMLNDRPGAGEAHATVAHVGIGRRASDYFAAMIMAEILSESSAKLGGGSVTVETVVEPRYLPGPLMINLKGPPGEIVDKVEGVLGIMTDLQTRQAMLDQIEAAKGRIINEFAGRLRSADGTTGIVLDIELYGLGKDYLVNFVDRVKAVAPGDVLRAAQTYLKPSTSVVVVAGPASQLEASLKRLGAVTALP